MAASISIALAGSLPGQAVAGPSQVSATTSSPSSEEAERGDAALARKDWIAAIDFYNRAQRVERLRPGTLLGLGRAHAGAGHELAALAWLRCYTAVTVALDLERARVPDEIVRLQVAAETKIRRIMQEGSDALQDLGELDPARAAVVRNLTIMGMFVSGDAPAAKATVLAATSTASERDRVWAEVASALAEDEDLGHAMAAADNISDVRTRDEVTRSLRERQAKAAQISLVDHWLSLARRLSEQPEIVNLDADLERISRLAPAEIPVRLLTLGSRLRAAYVHIQQLAADRHP